MFCSLAQILCHKRERVKTIHHKYTQDMKIYIFFRIYIKCLLFNPICTLFTRCLGNEVFASTASKYSQKKKKNQSKSQKMCNPKINPPRQKGQKKSICGPKLHRFPPVKFSKSSVILSLLYSSPQMMVGERGKVISVEVLKRSSSLLCSLVDDLVHGGLLVSRTCHDVFVICGDVTAQDGGRLLGLWEETSHD